MVSATGSSRILMTPMAKRRSRDTFSVPQPARVRQRSSSKLLLEDPALGLDLPARVIEGEQACRTGW